MSRTIKVFLISLPLCLLTVVPSASHASSFQSITLRVQYTTVENPVVHTTESTSEVKFTAYLRVENYDLADGDLVCFLFDTVYATIVKIGEGEFTATCSIKFGAQTPSGIQTIFMKEKQEMIGNQQKFRLIPDNARSIYTAIVKDSFGQPLESSAYGYEIFNPGAMFVRAPIAINPPANYSFPAFPKESNAFIIFDVRKAISKDLKTSLDAKRKILSVECPTIPLPRIPQISTGKTFRTILVFRHWGSRYLTDKENKFNIDYLTSDFKGKKLNLTCSYFIGVKDRAYQDLPLTYVESTSKMVTFPKK